MGSSVVALLRNYESRKDEIWNQTFNVMSVEMSFAEFVRKLERGSYMTIVKERFGLNKYMDRVRCIG